MIEPRDLRRHVIRPTLEWLGDRSASGVAIVLATYLAEGVIGKVTHLQQRGGGPAIGIYQQEPPTHRDHWDTCLRYKDVLRAKVSALASAGCWTNEVRGLAYPDDWEVARNLAYATAMCRIKYLRDPHPLPAADDLAALGQTWKRVYNTPLGKGSVEGFLHKVAPYRPYFMTDD